MFESGRRKLLAASSLLLTAPIASAQTIIGADAPDDWVSRAIGPDGLSLLIGLALVFVVIFVPLYFVHRRETRKYALYARFVDKEQVIPAELLPSKVTRGSSREREFIRGVWLGCFGLGIVVVLYLVSGEWRVAVWGLLPLFLAAACFINGIMIRTDDTSEDQTSRAG